MKKAVSLLLTLAVILSLAAFSPAASAVPMSDVTGELEGKVGVLQMLGVLSGYPDGTFRPTGSLTRAQFCKMSVVLMGKEGEIGLYKNYTVYPDVKSSYWASGYINLSVKSLGLIKGFTDGTFRPETPITYAQAITILMRALGYTDADVGLSWPAGYIGKAATIGLTAGLTVSANSPISRESGATLFYNMLSTLTKAGTKFASTIAGTLKEDAIILDNEAVAVDGTKNAVIVAGEATAIKARSVVPDYFVGLRGTLVLDSSGWIKAFIPQASQKLSFVLSTSDYPKITSTDGVSYTLASDTVVYMDGVKKTYSNVSYNLAAGTAIDLILADAGAIDYIIAGTSSQASAAAVLSASTSGSSLASMLGGEVGGKIYKNGNLSTVSDLKKDDVVTYNKVANVYYATDFKVTGIYESAYPNTAAPDKIKVLGTEFNVLDQAKIDLAKFRIGESITLLFTRDMQVASAYSSSALFVRVTGYYDGAAIRLINGPTLTATVDGINAGTLVKVNSEKVGALSVSEVYDNNPTGNVDLATGAFAGKPISATAVFYEKVGAAGKLTPIDRSDIAYGVIPSGKVFYAEYDSSGRVSVLVLNDVTGDRYIYGKLYAKNEIDKVDFGGTNVDISTRYAWVVNSGGKTGDYLCPMFDFANDTWGGLALNEENKVTAFITLNQYNNLTRQSFGTNKTVLINGVYTPISDEVHIYINSYQSFLKLSDYSNDVEAIIAAAQTIGTGFEAYTDKAPNEGGKVRIIVVR